MSERYHIIDMLGSLKVDRWVFLSRDEKNKTPAQLRAEFRDKWRDNLITAFPLLQEGETQQQLIEKGELYQRSHAEFYTVTFDPTNHNENSTHTGFLREAKLAGLQIETAVAIDTSKPWYRRILRREPLKMAV